MNDVDSWEKVALMQCRRLCHEATLLLLARFQRFRVFRNSSLLDRGNPECHLFGDWLSFDTWEMVQRESSAELSIFFLNASEGCESGSVVQRDLTAPATCLFLLGVTFSKVNKTQCKRDSFRRRSPILRANWSVCSQEHLRFLLTRPLVQMIRGNASGGRQSRRAKSPDL